MPGVFAAGDVRQGSIKRVASAVGEGATVVRLVHEHLREFKARGELVKQPEEGSLSFLMEHDLPPAGRLHPLRRFGRQRPSNV